MKPYPKAYPLVCVRENAKLQVSKHCKLKFAITSKFIDEVELDAIKVNICGIVLGSCYLHEIKLSSTRRREITILQKDGIEYMARAHNNPI